MAAAADSPIECTFVEMASFLRVTGYREEGATTSFAEATLLRLDAYIHFIQSLLDLFRGGNSLCKHYNIIIIV